MTLPTALHASHSYGTLSHAKSQIKTGGRYFMILRRALAGALFGLAVAVVAPVTTANAAPTGYPPDADVSVSVSASLIVVGGTVTVTGSGFAPNSSVALTTAQTAQGFGGVRSADASLGSFAPAGAAPAAAVQRLSAPAAVGVPTDASGSFRTRLTFDEVGTFRITGTGPTPSGVTGSASATLVVVADVGNGGTGPGTAPGGGGNASGSDGLPNTGASIGLPVTLGAALLLLGVALTTVVRRRKREDVSV